MKHSPEQFDKIVANTREVLLENNVPFEIKNHRHHFVIRTHTTRYDFWPSSGRYTIDCKSPIRSGGLTAIIDHINSNKQHDDFDVFDKDIEDMTNDELKNVIIVLCDKLNDKCK